MQMRLRNLAYKNLFSTETATKEQKNSIFYIKPVHSSTKKPVIVFINQKSGGRQGERLLQDLQSFLNPRQVFDISDCGPLFGLKLYHEVPNVRILVCGGDGTVGWVLSELYNLNSDSRPPIAVLPLGTGNDLSRVLGWGGGYTDQPISNILKSVYRGEVQIIDRWKVNISALKISPTAIEPNEISLRLSVFTNYMSIGVDADIALKFHQAREANPQKFRSRFRNKFYYSQFGGQDLFTGRWRNFSDKINIVCDGICITNRVAELRLHAVLFLNIPSYAGGTKPCSSGPQSVCDGYIEVIGLTIYQLPFLHAGGHGTLICRCKSAVIETERTTAIQLDGEACEIPPSLIQVDFYDKVKFLRKSKYTFLT